MAKKTGLGKGLESLMGEANAEVGSPASDSTLPITKVKPNKGQPRKYFNPDELAELADSIRQNGILQPLIVRKKGATYEIVAGERRYQAAKLADLDEVPVIIRDVSDEDVFKLALIENLQRSDLNPIEEAQGYKLLIEKNDLTQEEVARLVSKSRSAITNTLRLLDLPNEVQELMSGGKLTAGHARAILAVPSDEGRIRLAEKVVAQGLSVRQTETLAPLFSDNSQAEPVHRRAVPQSFKRAARQMRLALDTNVKVKTVRGRNKVEIEFESEEELAHLVDLLTKDEE
ncbi:ParB/RepB/Spo0J family partition protein [Tractidigestivibacter sp.]|uniref:ParB/RepB/Spo0J family partition protein n=1 Tax=Tractidigestivibacter sp. TaxID=2847320 RepID=UPI002A91C607|nr:ParB/RepB/Spo0J family partition protein [Tractidigestivibacter sp.]MDY5271234.1 ParB/RepB/Spo0J family partition protein [Tractidigestivibacter sp.]